MTILVAYVPRPEGQAALEKGIELARQNREQLIVVNVSAAGKDDESTLTTTQEEERVESLLRASGTDATFQKFVRGNTVLVEIEALIADHQISMLIIGIRKRTAVGKLILGSVARDILLSVACPVLAVKAHLD